MQDVPDTRLSGFPSGIIRWNWNDPEKIRVAPAQGHNTNREMYLIVMALERCWHNGIPAQCSACHCDEPRKVLKQCDSCPVQCMSLWWASKGVETMGFLPNALHVKWMKFKHWVIMTPLPWPILCLRPFQGIPILLNCFLFKGFLSFVFKAFLRGSYPFQWFICLRDSYPDRCFFHHLWGCGVFRFQVRHVFLLLLILLLVCLQDTCRIPSK